MRQDITHDVITEWFRYDPITGWFTWAKKHHYGPDVVGKRAGWQHSSGYRLLKLGDERLLEHRMVWLYVHGHLPTGPIDHIDRDRSNNKLANLRIVTTAINSQNLRFARKNKRGGMPVGIHAKKNGKFQATITKNGKAFWLGTYSSADEAHAAYLAAKQIHHSETASTYRS